MYVNGFEEHHFGYTGMGIDCTFGDSPKSKVATSSSNGVIWRASNHRIGLWRLQRQNSATKVCQRMHVWGKLRIKSWYFVEFLSPMQPFWNLIPDPEVRRVYHPWASLREDKWSLSLTGNHLDAFCTSELFHKMLAYPLDMATSASDNHIFIV